jgi:hypothetical protein
MMIQLLALSCKYLIPQTTKTQPVSYVAILPPPAFGDQYLKQKPGLEYASSILVARSNILDISDLRGKQGLKE